MDANQVARKLHALGKREAAALRQLQAIAAERCDLLGQVVNSGAAELSPETVALVIEPKD